MTYTLDWSETDLGGSAVVSYGSGAILDFTDKPSGATSALSITSHQADGVDNIVAEFSIVTTGSSVMTFDYKVSTESGWDKFHIDVDGVSQANYSGVVAWTTHAGISIPSAGTHTIRFRYTKDSGGAVNDDRVWVALLNITNTTTVNDASGSVDTYDMEDGAIPSVVTTSTWTNSTSAPIAGTRSLRSPASPANSGTYDLTISKAAGSDYAAVGFDFKVSSEAGWDKLFLFPDATASNVPATGSPSTAGQSGWLDWSGTASGRMAVILPATAETILLRYTKDGGGAGGADAAWIDNLDMPSAGGGTTPVAGTDTGSGVDAKSVLAVSLARADAGSGADVGTLAAALTRPDTATGTDAATLAAAAAATDTATGADAATPAASATGSETGAGADATSLVVAITAGDTAAAVDAVADLDTGATTKTGSDTAAAAETGTTAATTTAGDTAAAADTAAVTAARTAADTATATESATVTVILATSEAASATDLAALAATVAAAELAATLEDANRTDPGVIIVTPPERTYVVPPESRLLVVPAESRETTVPPENRTLEA